MLCKNRDSLPPVKGGFLCQPSERSKYQIRLTSDTGTGTQGLTPFASYVPHGSKPSVQAATLAYGRRIDGHTRDTLSAGWLEISEVCHCEGHL